MRRLLTSMLFVAGAAAAGPPGVAPTPQRLALGGLVPEGVRLAEGLAPAEVEARLQARIEAEAPGVAPGPSLGLLLLQVGARRLAADPEGGLRLMRRGLETVERYFPASSPPRLRARRALADALRLNGRPNAAEPHYAALLAHHRAADGPTHPVSLGLAVDLGDTHRRQKAFDVAEGVLSEALAAAQAAGASEVVRAAQLALGRLYAETAQPALAERSLRAALQGQPDGSGAAHLELAELLRAEGRSTAALAVLAPLVARSPAPLDALRLMGAITFDQGRYGRARGLLAAGDAQVRAAAGAKAADRMPWLYAQANAAGAAGDHGAAEALVHAARALAYAHPGLLSAWTPQFMELNQRLEQARAVAEAARQPPPRPIRLQRPLPPPPNRALARLSTEALQAHALEQATRGAFAEAARAGQRLVAETGQGRALLAGWLAQAGRVEAALWWLMEAAEREGLAPEGVAHEPDLAPLRADLRWAGLARWLEARDLHWRIHGPAIQVGIPGAEGPRFVVLPDDGSHPGATVEPFKGAAPGPGQVLAVSATWPLGPGRWRWSGRPELDGPHVLRQIDAAEDGGIVAAEDRPTVLVGLGAGAAVAAALALEDPERFAGIIALGRIAAVAPPARLSRHGAQRWWVHCPGGQLPEGPLLAALRAPGLSVRCTAGLDLAEALRAF